MGLSHYRIDTDTNIMANLNEDALLNMILGEELLTNNYQNVLQNVTGDVTDVTASVPDQLDDTLATLHHLTNLDLPSYNTQHQNNTTNTPHHGYPQPLGGLDGFPVENYYMNDFENISDISEPSPSPAPSVASSIGGSSFTFPPQAPTPEAALMLEDCLQQCPSVDNTSLFFKQEEGNRGKKRIKEEEKETLSSCSESKAKIAAHIKKRRRVWDLPDIPISDDDDDKTDINKLTSADLVRRERRRASNRRAATKCRLKKKAQEEESKMTMTQLMDENATLKREICELRSSRETLQERFDRHLATCQDVHR